MKKLALLAMAASGFAFQGCTTTDAVSLPFDLASTTGDAASSSSSGGSEETARLERERYVASQLEWIQRDAARGQGESLQALAVLLDEPDHQAFAQWTQANYLALFSELESPVELLQRIEQQRAR